MPFHFRFGFYILFVRGELHGGTKGWRRADEGWREGCRRNVQRKTLKMKIRNQKTSLSSFSLSIVFFCSSSPLFHHPHPFFPPYTFLHISIKTVKTKNKRRNGYQLDFSLLVLSFYIFVWDGEEICGRKERWSRVEGGWWGGGWRNGGEYMKQKLESRTTKICF